MKNNKEILFAAKSAPEERIFCDIQKAGLKAVELYLSGKIMLQVDNIAALCKSFPFRYAVHAPNDCYCPLELAGLVEDIGAEVVVFHDIYWEDQWKSLMKAFKEIKARLCVENISSIYNSSKFMLRYNLGRCLDLEHLEMECLGIFEEEFLKVMKEASHVHLTGYKHNSRLWHTHIHHSPAHSLYLLQLLKKSGYSGFVVSEAKLSFQTYREFKRLNDFIGKWKQY
jgi:sugar phosphate isomerase/epimerase